MTAEELRAAIEADPDEIATWIVYADWLIERDDPRGELILIELAIEAGTASAEAISRHTEILRDEDALLSPRLVEQVHHLELDLWRGFIRGAEVFGPEDDRPTADVLAALYADPHACLLRTLDLGVHVDLCSGPVGERVRELWVAACEPCELELERAFPNLSALSFHEGNVTRLVHQRLRQIACEDCEALRTGDFDLPALARLELEYGSEPLEFFGSGILSAPPPSLTMLVCAGTPELLRALRDSPLSRQLRLLKCVVLEEDAESFVVEASQGRIPFEALEVRYPCRDDAEAAPLIARAKSALPGAKVVIHTREDGLPSLDGDDWDHDPERSHAQVAQALDVAMRRLADRLRRR